MQLSLTSHRLLLLAIAGTLSACEFAPPPSAAGAPSAAPGASGSTPALGAAEPSAPAAPVSYAAFGPAASPDLAVTPFTVTTKPKAGGETWADVLRDDSAYDAFDPEVPVVLQAPGYGAGLSAPNGKISVRGKSTRQSDLKSFRVELDKEAAAWQGQQDVLLNKHPYDLSGMRNRLAFDLLQGIPELPAPKTWFATLQVDGTPRGFFTQVERVDKRFLARRGLDDKGALYQAEFFEFQRYGEALKAADASGYDEKAFEKHLEIGGTKDHRKLLAMLDAVNDPTIPINQTLDRHFDRANYVTWLAFNIVTDNLDTNSQNFFLYSPAGEGAWRFLPWDYDGANGYNDQDGRKRVTRWKEGIANWWGVTLHRRFLKDPENLRQLVARVDALTDQFFTRERVSGLLDQYKPVVGPAMLLQPDVERYDGASDPAGRFATEVDRLPGVFGAARERFKATLGRPMPIFLGTPRAADGGMRFSWDASFDLQGDALSYDLIIARDPSLKDVVAERKGLTTVNQVVPVPAGTYYYTVKIHDAKGEWQEPFSSYTDPSGQKFSGVERFEAP